jgi:LmbE family N-acetylglucosaminyl deacetylase
MNRTLLYALALALAAPLLAQSGARVTAFDDPANLAHKTPRAADGRALPIDGGVSTSGELSQRGLALAQVMRRLPTTASLMLIVAHPDDEDGGMLTYYSRGMGARVAMMTLNRGEGGQNAVTGDFEDALGLLRTQELLAEGRYLGVDSQMFGTEVDFGFSKTKAESFLKWGHERVLYDVVRAIRIYRPTVIASVFIGNPTDGHGQHQVAGEIAQEAFKAAGDPKVFPEMTREGILPWQPLRVFARVPWARLTDKGLFDYATGQYVPPHFRNYVTGAVSDKLPTTDVVISEGTTDPLLTLAAANPVDLTGPITEALGSEKSLSYAQFAAIGLSLQKSQIGAEHRMPAAGARDSPYHLYGSMMCDASVLQASSKNAACRPLLASTDDAAPGFFTGIDTSISGLAAFAPTLRGVFVELSSKVNAAVSAFDRADPETCAPLLATALKAFNSAQLKVAAAPLNAQSKSYVEQALEVKSTQLNQALVLALGLSLDATASLDSASSVVGQPLSVHVSLGLADMNAAGVGTAGATAGAKPVLYHRFVVTNAKSMGIGHSVSPNDPPQPLKPGIALVDDLDFPVAYTNIIERPYFTRPTIEQPYYDLAPHEPLRNAPAMPASLTATGVVSYQGVEIQVQRIVHVGEQRVQFVPPASLGISSHAEVLPDSAEHLALTLYEDEPKGGSPVVSEMYGAPGAWKFVPLSVAANCEGCVPLAFDVPPGHRTQATLRPSITLKDGAVITEGYRPVGYGPLPVTNFYQPATDRIVPVDLKLPPAEHRRIGYVMGTGDAVPDALAAMGLPVTLLTVADLTPAMLKGFDTVILGVRTYAAHPDLHGAPTASLLDFARRGGNVVVQYQTDEFTAADAPYPLDFGGNEKVVDELAPVEILTPQNALFTTPNTIAASDFDGWIEERGHGFLASWDDAYAALTETHDPGAPQEFVKPQAPQRGGLLTVSFPAAATGEPPHRAGRWTYVAFALYRQLPEAVPGAFRLFVNLLTPAE